MHILRKQAMRAANDYGPYSCVVAIHEGMFEWVSFIFFQVSPDLSLSNQLTVSFSSLDGGPIARARDIAERQRCQTWAICDK